MKRIMRVILEKTSALDQPGRMDFSPGIERGQPQKGTKNHKKFCVFLCLFVANPNLFGWRWPRD
jgi:hypothetical protein